MTNFHKQKYNIFNNIFISGKAGIGKTQFVFEMINKHFNCDCYVNKNWAVLKGSITGEYTGIKYVKYQKLMNVYSEDKELFRMQFDSLINCELLIIDDYGTASKSWYATDILLDILEERKAPIIVISNLSLDDISEKSDDRIASRLSAFYQIGSNILGNADHRQKILNISDLIIA